MKLVYALNCMASLNEALFVFFQLVGNIYLLGFYHLLCLLVGI